MYIESLLWTCNMLHTINKCYNVELLLYWYYTVTAIVEGIRQELRKIKSKCHVTISLYYNYILYIMHMQNNI